MKQKFTEPQLTDELKEAIELVLYGDKEHAPGEPGRIDFGEALELLKDAYEQVLA